MGDAILGQGITEHGSDYSRRTVNYLRGPDDAPPTRSIGKRKKQDGGREKNESAWRGTATAGTPCIMPRPDACSGTVHLRVLPTGPAPRASSTR